MKFEAIPTIHEDFSLAIHGFLNFVAIYSFLFASFIDSSPAWKEEPSTQQKDGW